MAQLHRTTLQDIADHVKLSRSSVALALRTTQSECPLLPETWTLINDAALRLNYRPNRLALSLSKGTSGYIGIVSEGTPALGVFSGRLIHHLSQSLSRNGQEILLIDTSGPAKQWIGKLSDGRIDGAVVVPPAQSLLRLHLNKIGVPLVGLNLAFDEVGVVTVRPDDAQAIALLATHLVELGHRQVAFFQDDRAQSSHYSTQERQAAFRADPRIRALGRPPLVLRQVHECLEAIRSRQATAIIGYSDLDALVLLTAAQSVGLSVPRDVSILGINDDPYVSSITPALTTVSLEPAMLADTACQHLMDALAGRPHDAREIRLPVRLCIRSSTAPPSAS